MKFIDPDMFIANNHHLTIVVNSCDAYSDVLRLFFAAFEEYWPSCPFPIVVNTESSALLRYSTEEKKLNSWGQRLIDILSIIETEYVLMVFDDFILENSVDLNKVNCALDVLNKDKMSSVFYLNAACVSDHKDDPRSDYRLLKDKVDYRLNSVPGIWKKTDLIGFTGPMDNPWSWEVFGSYRTFKTGKNFYSSSSHKKNIFCYDYRKGGAIYRGKWVREVVVPKNSKYQLGINFDERGFVDFDQPVKRSLSWKLNFVFLGFKSIGVDMSIFLVRYLKSKFFKGGAR